MTSQQQIETRIYNLTCDINAMRERIGGRSEELMPQQWQSELLRLRSELAQCVKEEERSMTTKRQFKAWLLAGLDEEIQMLKDIYNSPDHMTIAEVKEVRANLLARRAKMADTLSCDVWDAATEDTKHTFMCE